jgi:valyl-tRNA synthetase
MPILDARPLIVEKLKSKGLLVNIKEDYVHNVALSQRGKGMIEPQIKEQWFIDVNKRVVHWKRKQVSLKEVMLEVVKTQQIKIVPDRFEKTYMQWIENLRDWCISRQIWWGHRVPVWYKQGEGSVDMHVGISAPAGDGWIQDPDTLDTWFSSAQWTWSTLIDAKLAEDPSISLEDLLLQSPDFRKFHPTDVMETGYDLIFFWVARMILMTTYVTGPIKELEYGQVPFDTVYFHGLIRTKEGKKMSKSDPETMIDPLDMIAKYGADALRLSMIVGQSPGNDSRLYEEKIAGYRNFINKLWNASRFILLQCEQAGEDPKTVTRYEARTIADKWLIHSLHHLVKDVTAGMAEYRLSETGERLYAFVWDEFCDWYLELSKGEANIGVLVHALRTVLTLLHPYCPFVTEELWSQVKTPDTGMLIKHPWPEPHAFPEDKESFQSLQTLINVISAIRKLRTDQAVEPKKEVSVTIVAPDHAATLEEQAGRIKQLAKVGELTIVKSMKAAPQDVASAFLTGVEVHLSLAGLVDKDKEKANLQKEADQLGKFIGGIEAKLGNAAFVQNAPAALVDQQKGKLAEAQEKLKKIEERLKML